jgi:hypothetical protein
LPLEAEDVSAVIQTLREGPESFAHEFPLQPLIRTLEYFIKDHGQAKLQADLKWLRQWLGEDFKYSKLKVRLEKALASGPSSASKGSDTSAKKQPAAPASSEAVQALAPLLDDVVGEVFIKDSEYMLVGPFQRKVDAVPSGKKILEQGRQEPNPVVNLSLDRIRDLEGKAAKFGQDKRSTIGFQKIWRSRAVVVEILRLLLRRKLPLDEQTIVRLIGWPAESKDDLNPYVYPWPGLASAAENYAEANGASAALQAALEALAHLLRHIQSPMAHPKEWRQTAERLEALINRGPQVTIEPGEAWSDAALADLGRMNAKARSAWAVRVEGTAASLSGGRPGEIHRPLAQGSGAAARGRWLRFLQGAHAALVAAGGQTANGFAGEPRGLEGGLYVDSLRRNHPQLPAPHHPAACRVAPRPGLVRWPAGGCGPGPCSDAPGRQCVPQGSGCRSPVDFSGQCLRDGPGHDAGHGTHRTACGAQGEGKVRHRSEGGREGVPCGRRS